MSEQKPNVLIIWGDDFDVSNLSCYNESLLGYRTPNIDRIADEGMRFTAACGEQSRATTGAAYFIGITGPEATISQLLEPLGYVTGQFSKNHAIGHTGPLTRKQRKSDQLLGTREFIKKAQQSRTPFFVWFNSHRCTSGPTSTPPAAAGAAGGNPSIVM